MGWSVAEPAQIQLGGSNGDCEDRDPKESELMVLVVLGGRASRNERTSVHMTVEKCFLQTYLLVCGPRASLGFRL